MLTNLGIAFSLRFVRTGDLDDICEAIQCEQRAVGLTPDGHDDLPGKLANLGNSFVDRFGHTGDLDDISEAIQYLQRAVQLIPDGHPLLPMSLSNLGNAFSHRLQRTGDLDDISSAIQNQQRAVQLTPDEHAYLPDRLANLGNALFGRFELTGNLDDISEAIQNQQRAVKLTPGGHADLPDRLTNLGIAFSLRFERTGDTDDICEAIQNQECAVRLTPDGHPDLPMWLSNLGMSFLRRFKRIGNDEFLVNAVSNYRLSATSPTGPPSVRLDAAKRWASLSQQTPSLSFQLLDAYACIIQLLSLVSGLQNTIQRRHETLVDSSRLSIAACAAALSLDRSDKALEWLVEGRCIVWNQINQLRTPVDELYTHDRALAERFSTVSRELEDAGSRTELRRTETSLSMDDRISLEKQAGKHIKLAKERDRLLATIRNITGFEDFLRPRQCADIMRRLPDEGLAVIINVHDDRCDALALIAGSSEPLHIPLPEFHYQKAEHLARGLRRYLLGCGAISRALKQNSSPLPDLQQVLKVLWSDVVRPILDALAFFVCLLSSQFLR